MVFHKGDIKCYSFEMRLRFTLSSKSLLIELIYQSAGIRLPISAPRTTGRHADHELPPHRNQALKESLAKDGCFADLKGNGSDK